MSLRKYVKAGELITKTLDELEEYRDIGALDDLRTDLTNQKETLESILVSTILDILSLKSNTVTFEPYITALIEIHSETKAVLLIKDSLGTMLEQVMQLAVSKTEQEYRKAFQKQRAETILEMLLERLCSYLCSVAKRWNKYLCTLDSLMQVEEESRNTLLAKELFSQIEKLLTNLVDSYVMAKDVEKIQSVDFNSLFNSVPVPSVTYL